MRQFTYSKAFSGEVYSDTGLPQKQIISNNYLILKLKEQERGIMDGGKRGIFKGKYDFNAKIGSCCFVNCFSHLKVHGGVRFSRWQLK